MTVPRHAVAPAAARAAKPPRVATSTHTNSVRATRAGVRAAPPLTRTLTAATESAAPTTPAAVELDLDLPLHAALGARDGIGRGGGGRRRGQGGGERPRERARRHHGDVGRRLGGRGPGRRVERGKEDFRRRDDRYAGDRER